MNYYNSMIERKKGRCIDCPSDSLDKYLIAERCDIHYKIFRKLKILHNRQEKSKVRSLINTPANKNLLVKKEKIVDSELELFFLSRMHNCQPICENCGAIKDILKHSEYSKLWRSCQAHLLPKRHFKSISHHPLIGMVLGSGYSGLCHCHDTYDSSWEAASKMNIWPEVVNRFKILYPLIKPEEHQFIPQILLDTL